jgi:hypothetical protein
MAGKRIRQSKVASYTFALVFGLLFASNVWAEKVSLPENALRADTNVVIWIDVEHMSSNDLKQALDAVVATAPEDRKASVKKQMAEAFEVVEAYTKAWENIEDSGLEQVVIAGYGTTGPDDDDDAEEPEEEQQMLLKMKAGTDPKKAMTIITRTVLKELPESMQPSADDLSLQTIEELDFKKLSDGWYSVEGKQFLATPDAGKAADQKPFEEAISRHDGAAVRMVWQMDPATRQSLAQAQLDPGTAMFLGGMIQPLRNMNTMSSGIWLGKSPKLVVNMSFKGEADARQFKAGLEQTLTLVSMMMAMGEQDAAETAKMRTAMALLFLDQDGVNLSKTIDVAVLKQLAEAGLLWQEEAAEDAGMEEME